VVELGIDTADGTRVATSLSADSGPGFTLAPGQREIIVELDLTLLPGDYSITVGLHEAAGYSYDYVESVLTFSVVNLGYGDTPAYPWEQSRGYVRPASRWSASGADERLAPLLDREQ
jgi:hypothetical protein